MRSMFLCLMFVLFGFQAQAAGQIESAYTKVILDDCTFVAAEEVSSTYAGYFTCEGYKGMPMAIAEGDLRMFVSFGTSAREEVAYSQTLPMFNTINETFEWRLLDGKPFATILRWFTDDGLGATGQVLVVSQILAGHTCHIAYVDALANKNANVLAREAADTLAGRFDCQNEPKVLGNPGLLDY
ncbi:MAG: hypothetical protein HWE23_09355 [Rhodobacteraceae bacterium]|nr:hypothetical protein [Paracoccaceae bacterium]